MQNRILEAIKGSNAQNPMSISALKSKLGVTEKPLEKELEAMFVLKQISRAYISRPVNGKLQSELYVWPTGIIQPERYATVGAKVAPTPLPRRDEIKTTGHDGASHLALTLGHARTIDMVAAKKSTQEQINMTEKPTALRLLEHIEAHPNCPYSDFTNILNTVAASAFLGNHIARGDVIKTQVGPRKYNYSLIAGKTALDIYNGGQRTNVRGRAKKIKSESAATVVIATLPIEPAFSLTPEATFNEVTEQLDAEFYVQALFKLLPDGYEITLCNRETPFAVIYGGVLNDDGLTIQQNQINDTLNALKTLNNVNH